MWDADPGYDDFLGDGRIRLNEIDKENITFYAEIPCYTKSRQFCGGVEIQAKLGLLQIQIKKL